MQSNDEATNAVCIVFCGALESNKNFLSDTFLTKSIILVVGTLK